MVEGEMVSDSLYTVYIRHTQIELYKFSFLQFYYIE